MQTSQDLIQVYYVDSFTDSVFQGKLPNVCKSYYVM